MGDYPPLPEVIFADELVEVIRILESIVGVKHPQRPSPPLDRVTQKICLLYVGRINEGDSEAANHLMTWLGLEPPKVMDTQQQTGVVNELMVQGLMHSVPRELPLSRDQLPNPRPIRRSAWLAENLGFGRAFDTHVPIAVLCYNARGAANPAFDQTIENLVTQYEPDLLIITETRVSGDKARDIGGKSWIELEGFSEGIWILWDPANVEGDFIHGSRHEMTLKFKVSLNRLLKLQDD
ncbi:hypothetical protein CCACVL1_29805 [Corchorus capsularis]|uniref:Endonuclease/exonuclease/phosphatase n=1 Tax=Corchorus capsularis TaxID=210143 RepID=A0A1R3G003_COCAP|nr:hypothetical protein CCACVL1_29805 [Corchorus capsularis]